MAFEDQSTSHNQRGELPFNIVYALLLAEGFALVFGGLMALTPTFSGTTSGLATHFFDNPTFVHEFIVCYLAANILMAPLLAGLIIWAQHHRTEEQ